MKLILSLVAFIALSTNMASASQCTNKEDTAFKFAIIQFSSVLEKNGFDKTTMIEYSSNRVYREARPCRYYVCTRVVVKDPAKIHLTGLNQFVKYDFCSDVSYIPPGNGVTAPRGDVWQLWETRVGR